MPQPYVDVTSVCAQNILKTRSPREKLQTGLLQLLRKNGDQIYDMSSAENV